MEVVLINPPFFDVYKGYEKAARIGATYPPTGLLYLASKLQSDGHEVRLFDVDVENMSLDELIRAVIALNPDLIGITATTPIFHKACEIAKGIKGNIDVPIVLGGHHVTILRESVIKEHPIFDYAVIGEGEITFSELARCLERKGDPAEIEGLIMRKEGTIVSTPNRPFVTNIDELPFPARNLVEKNAYLWTPPGKGVVPIASVLTKRGCPFNCAFCSAHSMFGHKVRYRSTDNVLNELEEIVHGYGIHHVIFLDDTFLLKREQVLQICEGIHKRGLKFTWEALLRADVVDKEILQTMASAGLTRGSFGIESGDQEILNGIRKGVTLDQIRQAYAWAKQAGIETRGSAIIGHPGETRQSAWRTIRFLRGLKHLDQVYINIMVPYPGTEVYELAKKGEAGYRLLSEDFEHYIRYNEAVLEVNDLDAKELKKLQKIGLWMFYMTPRRVIYNLRRSGLKNGFRMALAMLGGLLSKPEGN